MRGSGFLLHQDKVRFRWTQLFEAFQILALFLTSAKGLFNLWFLFNLERSIQVCVLKRGKGADLGLTNEADESGRHKSVRGGLRLSGLGPADLRDI